MPQGWVHAQLANGRAVVLIDGVHELPSTQRPAMLERLQQLASSYPLTRYIVTSRPAALKAELWPEWQEWIEKENFVETSLQPMSPAHIDNFIDQWHEAIAKTINDDEEIIALKQLPGNLKRQLRQRPPLRRLADNPLLCAMICALHRERHENLPSERIDLYRGCVEMLLSRRDEGRKIYVNADYPELSDAQKLAFAQSFAYWLMKNGYSDVDLAEADRHFEGKRDEMNLPRVTGDGVRRWFVERASLLREPVAQRIDFAHRTFQEYLAAQAAIKENDIGVLIKHGRDDQWRETIILAVGEARPKEREKLLKGLLTWAERLRTERHRKQLYLLAVACLETCVELSSEVRQLVLDKAAPFFHLKMKMISNLWRLLATLR
ncbi:MAG: NACHT domain-containing protein [bacterium]